MRLEEYYYNTRQEDSEPLFPVSCSYSRSRTSYVAVLLSYLHCEREVWPLSGLRFLYWLSHGVPVVFAPYLSYVELAGDGDYRLPSGRVPAAKHLMDIPGSCLLVSHDDDHHCSSVIFSRAAFPKNASTVAPQNVKDLIFILGGLEFRLSPTGKYISKS